MGGSWEVHGWFSVRSDLTGFVYVLCGVCVCMTVVRGEYCCLELIREYGLFGSELWIQTGSFAVCRSPARVNEYIH